MKTIACIGAVLSFLFFLIPGVRVLNLANSQDQFAFIVGFSLIGFAFFAGTLLWIIAQKCCSKQDSK